jgi:hypothetical protein
MGLGRLVRIRLGYKTLMIQVRIDVLNLIAIDNNDTDVALVRGTITRIIIMGIIIVMTTDSSEEIRSFGTGMFVGFTLGVCFSLLVTVFII